MHACICGTISDGVDGGHNMNWLLLSLFDFSVFSLSLSLSLWHAFAIYINKIWEMENITKDDQSSISTRFQEGKGNAFKQIVVGFIHI